MADGASRPKFAFVIDQRKCIGCHACTVACKQENAVPLAKFRTWVKYVEKGAYPSVKRHFTVLRCNHCDAAPCVEICPVIALHKRPDAIVDLDRDRCIGCRACMQACPYDALYLNEDSGVAEKCHYCAHRTEVGLEPACVVVCPERAIVAGDASDPESPISKLIRDEKTSQRRLEKGTKPRLWYIDALPEALEPGKPAESSMYMWSERPTPQPVIPPGFEPPPDLLTTLDVGHAPQWGWHIWTYLLTKNVGAGAAIVAPFLAMLGVREGAARDYVPEIVALVMLVVTTILLVHDLGRPERFLKVVFAGNSKSWLVKGGWFLTAFGVLVTANIAFRLLGMHAAADAGRWITIPFGVMLSGYSAFLFAQCRARDLWLSKALFLSLVTEAALCGATLAILLPGEFESGASVVRLGVFVAALCAVAFMPFVDAKFLPKTDHARRAHAIFRTAMAREAHTIWLLAALLCASLGDRSVLFGTTVLPVVANALAAGFIVLALLLRGRAWIRAGQAVPIS
ncbi:MAG: 4Fe-4S dicluster domain-containing protein [Planctomycetes bacterium]|nr:4Fe-4S dicluster domain-containing protein [Planctomycetota bacterium]